MLDPKEREGVLVMDENRQGAVTQYLTFVLSGEYYAIDVINIKEILRVPNITRVPRMPNYLNSVINLRGSVIPVLDLRLKFGIGVTEITPTTSIIVTEIPSFFQDGEGDLLTIGIFSEGDEQVIDLSPSEIEPPPSIGVTIDTSFITGMGKYKENFILLLNMGRLFSEQELI